MRLELLEKFEEIINSYQREIVSFHFRLVGNRAEAEDLSQETFIRAYKKFETLREVEKARSWLYRIARNVAIDFFRRSNHRELSLDQGMIDRYSEDTAIDHEAELVNSEISRELAKCIELLKPEERMIVKLLYYEGFSYREIAAMLNVNSNTLKSRLHRARQALLEIIKGNPVLSGVAVNI